MSKISEQFKSARKELGLTQGKMAEKLGLESGKVSRLKNLLNKKE